MAVTGSYALAKRVTRRGDDAAPRATARARRAAAAIAVAAVVLGLGSITRARNRDYWSAAALWADTVQKRPGNARARINYGIELMALRRYAEAEAQMRAAVDLDADRETKAQVYLQLGSALSAQGRFDEGIPALERALALDATIREADAILGQAYSDRGDIGRAVTHLSRAVERMPDNWLLLNRLAWLLATAPDAGVRNGAAAAAFAERAVALTGGQDFVPLETLAAAYAEQGRLQDAVATIGRAIAIARARGDRDGIAALERQLAAYQSGLKAR